MMEAVISLKTPMTWVSEIAMKYDIHIKILDCIPHEGQMRDLAEIALNRNDVEKIVEDIRGIENVTSVDIEQVERDRAWVVVSTSECLGCCLLKDHSCFLIIAETGKEGEIIWKLVFTEKRHLQELVWGLKDAGIEVKIRKISKFTEKESLTERQEMMIRQALALGYYDFPKRIGIRELAEKFEVSTATLSETLRRGQKKILENYFQK